MAPEDDQTQILWSDGWAWLANRVGVMSTPGRTDMLKKPTRVTHQALLSDQGLNIVVVFAHLGPLQAEALQQLASWAKHQGSGFRGRVTRSDLRCEWTKALGRITQDIEGRETQGVLGQNESRNAWVWGESKANGFDGEYTIE